MSDSPLRLVFAGTPAFAAGHLAHLVDVGATVVGVFTQPDRPVGRGKQIRPTPVKEVAIAHDIPVFQPPKLDQHSAEQLAALSADVMVVVAYGQILGRDILAIPRHGCINVHASLLPRWRGAAPVERAILDGDRETGISIMQMDAGLDTGDVLLTLSTPISDEDDAGTVTQRLSTLGNQGLETVLENLAFFQANAKPQNDHFSTYAAKLAKEEACIDWQNNALAIQHQVQAFFPRSPAYFWKNRERMRILKALALNNDTASQPGTVITTRDDAIEIACGTGVLSVTRLQLAGKKPATARDILNGHRTLFTPGATLAEPAPAS